MKEDNEFYLYKYLNLEGEIKDSNGNSKTRMKIFEELLIEERIFIPSLELLNDPFELEINNLVEKIVMKRGILSFTTDPFNLLMWSHYGASHKGAVVRFKVEKTEYKNFLKVQYVKNRSELSILNEPILVKSYHWSYENEYRRVFDSSENYSELSSIGLSVDAIFFGANCPSYIFEQIELLLIYCNLPYTHMKLSQNFECQFKTPLMTPNSRSRANCESRIEDEVYDEFDEPSKEDLKNIYAYDDFKQKEREQNYKGSPEELEFNSKVEKAKKLFQE